ncbi:hypothetical protein [Burkholderia sp. WSM2230]|uniref:hypothetical protein n=1 Tax=Burkholderia sp. WSM2230 TaxID=944435 RepID=UPI00041170CA|nr:hypothetical protein [Burkholderia sp. WSM2230]
MTSKKHSAPPSAAKQPDRALDSTESRLDEALEESFPASDPIAVHEHDGHRASEPQSQPQSQPVGEKKRR